MKLPTLSRKLLLLLVIALCILAATPHTAQRTDAVQRQDAGGIRALDPDTKDNIAMALWLSHFDVDEIPPEILDRLGSAENSNAAFGERMGFYLTDLLEHPDSFTPSYRELYEALIKYSRSLSPHQAYAMFDFLGLDRSRGYQPVPIPEPDNPNFLQFPQDNAVDLSSRIGWYYLVGSATGDDGKQYGVLVMLFRTSLLPLPIAQHFGLNEVDNQVVELQFAISEAGDRHYQATPTVVAGTTGLLGYKSDEFFSVLGKNAIMTLPESEDGSVPLRVQALGWDRGATPTVELAVDLTFAARKAYLRQGINGCDPCCGRVGYLYYSVPNLRLDANKSSLTLKGQTVRLVDGTFWLDHQWGTVGNPRVEVLRAFQNLQTPQPSGWDWFEAQFEGNRQLTMAALHNNANAQFYGQTGPNPPGTMTVTVSGKYMDEHSNEADVCGTLQVTEWVRSEATPDPSQYAITQTWYPNKWAFNFAEQVPTADGQCTAGDSPVAPDIQVFTMVPIVQTGSSLFFASGFQYQEAPVNLLDGQGRLVGSGFAEAVGYANTVESNVRNRLRLAGLPDSKNMLELVKLPAPSEALQEESRLFLSEPKRAAELALELEMCREGGQ